jgi:acyl-CoA synthetase (NDP forming)
MNEGSFNEWTVDVFCRRRSQRRRSQPTDPATTMTIRPDHRLSPLLSPRSVAIVGASPRSGNVGLKTLQQLVAFGFAGAIYPVNPKYGEIEGHRCFPDLSALPEAPEMTVLSVPNAVLEAELRAAVARGTRAATIFASGYLENDAEPPLNRRLAAIAGAAGIPVCGANGMGFYNFADKVAVCGFAGARRKLDGGITLITHSGSVVSALADCEDRLGYALVVSTGNEIVTGLADYMDWALARTGTTAIGLFIETARRPAEFVAALERAAAMDVPVVALKVGRTAMSKSLAVSHSGALAGNDAAYRAVFDRYGVIAVDTLDEMAATLQLMTAPRRVRGGGLATMHDSGGERGLWIDRAHDIGVPFARISDATRDRLADVLDFGLEPVNPLDAWGTGKDYVDVFADCLTALAADPDTALTYFAYDREEHGRLSKDYAVAAERTFERVDKPVAVVASRHGSGSDDSDLELVRAGIPVIDGEWWALKAARHAFAYRDFRNRPPMTPPAVPRAGAVAKWRARLERASAPFGESEGLHLLADFGLPAAAHRLVASREAALTAARELGLPVALKTAAPGIAHKSDVGGVRLGLASEAAVAAAYDDLAARLGTEVTVAVMAPKGVELAVGVVADPDFGPLVMIGAGGALVELLDDRVFLLAPFDAATALRAIRGLRIARLLDGYRGSPQVDAASAAQFAARLSEVAVALAGRLAEIDVNPLIVLPAGCVAVDALVVTSAGRL